MVCVLVAIAYLPAFSVTDGDGLPFPDRRYSARNKSSPWSFTMYLPCKARTFKMVWTDRKSSDRVEVSMGSNKSYPLSSIYFVCRRVVYGYTFLYQICCCNLELRNDRTGYFNSIFHILLLDVDQRTYRNFVCVWMCLWIAARLRQVNDVISVLAHSLPSGTWNATEVRGDLQRMA